MKGAESFTLTRRGGKKKIDIAPSEKGSKPKARSIKSLDPSSRQGRGLGSLSCRAPKGHEEGAKGGFMLLGLWLRG